MRYKLLLFIFVNLYLTFSIFSEDINGWSFKYGFENRFRYEYKSNYDFDDETNDEGSIFYNRLRINGKAELNKAIELFAEGLDGRVWVENLTKPSQEDDFDLHQAYVLYKSFLETPIDLKIGRQAMKYGKGRLISASSWPNKINAFDAFLTKYKAEEFSLDVFYGSFVIYEKSKFNDSNNDIVLKGIYYSYQLDKDASIYEVYAIENDNTASTNDIDRKTIGTRIVFNNFIDGYVPEIEACYQYGSEAEKDIKNAYAFNVNVSTELNLDWSPKVTVEYNYATGDENLNDNEINSFIPLYQITHDSYGIMDFFRWQNMREIACNVALETDLKIKIITGINFFWVQNKNDYWYNAAGTKIRRYVNENTGRFIGTESSIVVKYDINDNIKVDCGYAHFFTGSYIKETGVGDDVDWSYAQVNVKL